MAGRRAPASSVVVVLLLLLPVRPAPRAVAEDESPVACPIRALLFEKDAFLERVFYKGVVRGLEQANLPRICLEDPVGEAEILHTLRALEADPPPLLFVLGAQTRDLLGARLAGVPRVYVDTAWVVNEEPHPASPKAGGAGVAVVRAQLGAIHLSQILRDLGFRRPVATLSWKAEGAVLKDLADRLAQAGGFRRGTGEEAPEVLLHVRLHEGEVPAKLSTLLETAETRRIPLVSDDLSHWGRGAAVVFLPDADLLGRVAAEEGRRLLLEPGASRPLRAVGAYEIRVDLDAAARQGLEVPLRFLAEADRIRRRSRRAGGSR